MQTLTITRPDDMHLHLRDNEAMMAVVPFSAKQMGRAVIMPNLKPPVCDVQAALSYRKRIIQAIPAEYKHFTPLMSLYLTDKTTPQTVYEASNAGIISFKLYPAGATTNSDDGVTDLWKLQPTLEAIAEKQMILSVHGEVVDANVDIFDREAVFIDKILIPLLDKIPNLRIVFEHITTKNATKLVEQADERLAATVTPQHLLFNRNHLLVGGIRPHFYCLPIIKREEHRIALIEAVTGSSSHKFFLGTDSAPHAQNAKENACGCAGVFSAHAAIEIYAQIFDNANALDKLEAFSSKNAAKFFRLPENKDKITLIKQKQQIVNEYDFGNGNKLIPLFAGESIEWSIVL